MKLEDIDVLNQWRTTYKNRVIELKSVKSYNPGVVQFKDAYVKDHDIMVAVRLCVLPLLEAKLNEAKTKLMMLGITEFPE